MPVARQPGHIVTIHESASVSTLLEHLPKDAQKHCHAELHEAGVLCMDNNTPQSVLDQLQEHELVHSVAKEATFKVHHHAEAADAIGLQGQAPWGLARLISDGPLGTVGSKDEDQAKYTYVYDKDTAGRNVTVYMLCTGVRADHETFEGRVSAPADANFIEPGMPQEDAVGQGTHTAGTILSSAYGVAKHAKLVSIKVFDVESVTSSPILQGINYAIKKAKHDEGPSILLIPIEGTADNAVDLACKRALRNQVHVVVASGNSGADAVDVSPARLAAESALITVSASRIDDVNLDYSNFGDVVTVWAPGSRILSAYPSSKTGAAVASGTAVASAHVAGLLAVWLSEQKHKKAAPKELKSFLQQQARPDVQLTTAPQLANTTSLLAHF